MMNITARHTAQDHTDATYYVQYWGYTPQTLPCTSDKNTCTYLDAVYRVQAKTTLYSCILWAVLAGCFALTILACRLPGGRVKQTLSTLKRRYLLKEASGRWLFGRVTRLQVTLVTVLAMYLLIFSMVGLWYEQLYTPVKKRPGVYTKRTGLSGWSSRVGVFAYALTPFSILLCMRESVLSLATSIPYQHFNFLHRWTGYIIFLQASFHTIGWTIIEAALYRNPDNYRVTMSGQYIIFGVVAQFFITFLYVFSTPWFIRRTGYEFFKKSHTLIAVLYMGACVGHWYQLYAWLLAAFILTCSDFAIRGLRTLLLHSGYGTKRALCSFECAKATVQRFGDAEDEAVRVDFEFEHSAWQPGQHFYLCFPALGIWQSHPFTPCSVPRPGEQVQKHTYLIRAHAGITKRLAQIAETAGGSCEMSVIVTGPYGASTVAPSTSSKMFVAGGTGVTSVLPSLQVALAERGEVGDANAKEPTVVDFTWIIRKSQDLLWLAPEITAMKTRLGKEGQTAARVHIYVTREAGAAEVASSGVSMTSNSTSESERREALDTASEKKEATTTTTTRPLASSSSSSILADLLTPTPSFSITHLDNTHPAISDLIPAFAERAALVERSVSVLAAGPPAMGTHLRAEVAVRNCVGDVWKRFEGGAWELEWDCRS